jgi:predicted RNA binding protein YcfA (HicA-like mRNA interferase family)
MSRNVRGCPGHVREPSTREEPSPSTDARSLLAHPRATPTARTAHSLARTWRVIVPSRAAACVVPKPRPDGEVPHPRVTNPACLPERRLHYRRSIRLTGSVDSGHSGTKRVQHKVCVECVPVADGRAEVRARAGRASGSWPTVSAMPKKYRDVRRALEDAGWQVVRQRGSHEVWAHPDRQGRIVVAGKDSATVPVGTLGSIRRASGIEDLR